MLADAATSEAKAQAALQQRLEEYRRQKALEKLKTPAVSKTSRAFVVTAPKRDPLADFVPSIIRSEPLTSSANNEQKGHSLKEKRRSCIFTCSQPHLSPGAKKENEDRDHEWDLNSEMNKVFAEAQKRAGSEEELKYLSHCISTFKQMLREVTTSSACDASSVSSIASTPLQRPFSFTPERNPFLDRVIPVHDKTKKTLAVHRPPTPANFHEIRDGNVGAEVDEDLEDAKVVAETKSAADDIEVEFQSSVPCMDDQDELDELAGDMTPPESKFLRSIMTPSNPNCQDEDDVIFISRNRPNLDVNTDEHYKHEGVIKVEPSDKDPATPDTFGSVKNKNGTPHPKKGNGNMTPAAVQDISALLSGISLLDDEAAVTPVKQDRKLRSGKEVRVAFAASPAPTSHTKKQGPAEVVVGSAANADGSVVVLTPRKANRKEKEALGVDSVVTNARRSMRFIAHIDMNASPTTLLGSAASDAPVKDEAASRILTASTHRFTNPLASFGPDAEKRVQRLLEEHGNAFVPNKVLPMPGASTPGAVLASPAGGNSFAKARRSSTAVFTHGSSSSPFTVHAVSNEPRVVTCSAAQENGELTPKGRRG
ncbi:hypothetical protein BC830DRAFT_1124321 [Chytriomyces sp. MP71]|nr:hypothetical protein BC830DRAFT_1124321 [Chytriomyces sp. MP71]